MQFRPFVIPFLLLGLSGGLVAWLFIAEPPKVPAPETRADKPVGHAASSGQPSQGRTEPPPVPLPYQIRNVSPDGVTPPKITGTLTRIEPSQPYLDLKNPPVAPVPEGPFELQRPRVLSAGILKTDDLTVHIAHVDALAADQTCVSRLGGTWPCGARARTSLRGLVRLYTISCEKIAEIGPREISAVCFRRKTDLGAWLLRYGWADATAGAPDNYRKLAQNARQKKKGMWQSEWLEEPVNTAPEKTNLPTGNLEDLLPGLPQAETVLDDPINPFDLPLEPDQDLQSDLDVIEPEAPLRDLPPVE
jgi:endonuclease YncB( thermonuclease family)